MRKIWLGSLLLIFVAMGCKKEDSTTVTIVDNAFQNELRQLVNDVRLRGCNCGGVAYPAVGAVVWNDKLAQAAKNHSDDMATNNYFSHTSPSGQTVENRLANVGYNWRTYGENIAQGYASAEDVIAGWLASTGHCQNIMDGDFTEMGVAVNTNGNYWTQVFGKPQ